MPEIYEADDIGSCLVQVMYAAYLANDVTESYHAYDVSGRTVHVMQTKRS